MPNNQATLNASTRTVYVVYTTVVAVREHVRNRHISGAGPDAIFQTETLGWFVHFAGSYEAIHMGPDKPEFAQGDRVKITFEKV
jgi:hypothetical protein